MADRQLRESSGAQPRLFYGYIVVVSAMFIITVIFGVRFAFGVFFIPMSAEFGWTRAMTSGAFSLSMAFEGLLAIVMGGLNDRLGPRVVMILCAFFLGLGYLLMSQVNTVWQLYLFYGVIIGIGMSATMVPLLSTVARWFTKRRGMMTGIALTGTGIGALIAPPVANQLIAAYDWRTSYVILGSLILVAVVLAAQLLRRDPISMGQTSYGENEGEQGLNSLSKGFSLREAVCTSQFWVVFGMGLCLGCPTFAITVHIVPHATELGISAAGAASILATVGGLMIVGKLVMGSASDRIGYRTAFIIGFVLMSAALFWLVPATELWALYLFAAVFGLAEGGMGLLISPLVATLFGLSSHGSIFGLVVLGFTAGAAIGPLMSGYIFDVTGSYQVAFLACAAISIAGLALTAFLKPIAGERGQMEAS